MLPTTFVLSLLAGAAVAQLTDSNLKTHVGTCSLSASFNPVKAAYWTDLPHHRRTPFAVSPNGKSAYLAYLDASETDVHVQQVDPSTFAAVGDAVTVTGGKEAGGLVAHDDGFALLTNEAMPSGTANAPPDSTPVAVLYRYTSGKQTFKTYLGGPDNVGDMGALASPDMNGDLAYSEKTGMYGAYFVVTAYSGEAKGHFGDSIQYVTKDGTLKQIQGASSSWGCSHNTGIALEGADEVPFPSLCSEDQGAIWLNTGGTGMDKGGVKVSNEHVQNGAGNEAMGGMGGSYSSLARFIDSESYIFSWVSRGAKDLTVNDWMGEGYTHSVNRTVNRNVAIATFSDKKTIVGEQATSKVGGDGDSQVNWITTGSADCQNAHVAAFDKTNAVVTWEEIAEPTCENDAMGCKGAFTGSYFQLVNNGKKVGEPVKSMDVFVAGDMVSMGDGRVCWPYVDMDWKLDAPVMGSAESVKKISFACMGLNGAGSDNSTTAPASSAKASSKAPAATSVAAKSSAAAEKPVPVEEVAESTGLPTVVDTTADAASTPAPEASADSALPTFEVVTSGATITPPTTSAPVVKSTALPEDPKNDLPAPYDPKPLPSSESFYPSEAPAFTGSSDAPLASIKPVYSSIISEILGGILPTEVPALPTVGVPSAASSTALPAETPAPVESEADLPPYPTGTGSQNFYPSGYPTGTGMRSLPSGFAHPTGAAFPTGRPGFGWGRPRHHGHGHHQSKHHGNRGHGGPKPSVAPQPENYGASKAQGKASSTPCTFETRVKPSATATPAGY